MKRELILLLGLLICRQCFSQTSNDPSLFPKMTPPSPDAASLGRYGEFPVTLSTGTPQISVPLYDVKSGKLKLPISLSYHASGIRVNDISNRVGLGWSLMAGGVITRVIKSLPDDNSGTGYLDTGIPLDTATGSHLFCFLNRLTLDHLKADGEPDDYFYNFNSKNGRFVFSNREVTGTPVPVTIPHDLIKIAYSLYQIKITDVDGTVYVFGTSLAGRTAYELSHPVDGSDNETYGVPNVVSSWYLTDILSADRQDTIKLIYSTPKLIFHERHNTNSFTDDLSDPETFQAHTFSTSMSIQGNSINEVHLTDILFRNGKVSFEYATDRLDVPGDSTFTGMRVYQYFDNAYKEIKHMTLYHSYFTCRNIAPQSTQFAYNPGDGSKRLRLDSVKESDINGNFLPGYLFNYNNKQLPYPGSYAQDFWGFYNAASTNTNMLIYYFASLSSHDAPSAAYGANRNVNIDSVDAAMLTKITYPTGGTTAFTFEPNMYSGNAVGGLRIKKIVSRDGNGGGVTKTYNYYDPMPINNLFTTDVDNLAQFYKWNFYEDLPDNNGIIVRKDFNTYYENMAVPLGSSSGAAVTYARVEELYDSTGGVNGKTEFTYTTNQDESPANQPQNVVSNEWRRGLEMTKKIYKSASAGNYTLLSSKKNVYSYVDRPALTVVSLTAKCTLSEQNVPGIHIGWSCGYDANNTFNPSWNPMLAGNVNLTQTIDSTFDQNGLNPEIDTTNYYFDDTVSIYATRTEKRNSKGSLIKTIQRTPLEKADMNVALTLSAAASTAIDSLLSKNMIAPVLDEEKYIDGRLLSRTRTNYKVFTAQEIAQSNIQVQIPPYAIETRMQFNGYDAYGNILSGGKPADAPTTYIWDYQKSFVAAEVMNSDTGYVAYTSFESDGTGYWNFTDTTRNRIYALTGSRSYTLVTGKPITRSIVSGKASILSYWSRSGVITVTANGSAVSSSLTGVTKNGWTYYEHVLPATTTSISLSATSAIIDELRLYPQASQMTTYTYNPLIGVSSVCAPNNYVIYYEYDGFRRLKDIRDMDKNVVKAFDYEYQVYPHPFYSASYSSSFPRTNCTSCAIGGSYTYTVPANRYISVISQADANAKALADLAANGPTQANTYGTCTAPTTASITATNSSDMSFTLKFYNTCSGVTYTFSLSANNVTGMSLSNVPTGTYNITVTPTTATSTVYYVNFTGNPASGTSSIVISGVSVSTNSNTLNIHS